MVSTKSRTQPGLRDNVGQRYNVTLLRVVSSIWVLKSQTEEPLAALMCSEVVKVVEGVIKNVIRSALKQARHLMSRQLVQQVDSKSIDTSLATIDSWSDGLRPHRKDALEIGPFRVIDFTNVSQAGVQPSLPAEIVSDIDHTFNEPVIDDSLRITTPSSQGLATSIPDYLQWSDLFDLEFDTWLGAQPDDFGINTNSAEPQLGWPATSISVAESAELPTTSSALIDDPDMIAQAAKLIKNFSNHVIGAVGALPFNAKSPFEILNVTSAIQTYADITYLGRPIKHANAANFCSVLACSAYYLAVNDPELGNSSNGYWLAIATRAGNYAKAHLQKSLQSETQGNAKAKYKDQLMALICTLTYAIMAGHQRDARCYMIDAERLLRVRGLAKRQISRRARLMHHMYTWFRIVGESTYVLHEIKGHVLGNVPIPPSAQNLVLDAGHNARLDDFLRIERPDDQDLDLEEQKDPAVGLHDIHLQDSRTYQDTMYLQIYGLPETWLSLLSQTTRLANVVDAQKAGRLCGQHTAHKSIEKRATRLEDMICSFAARSSSVAQSATPLSSSHYMLQAMNAALVLYFYRRIRNVNSLILQSHVDEVIEALRNFDLSLIRYQVASPGTAWPAFIAGCEASPGPRRDYLSTWVSNAFAKTGLQSYKAAETMMSGVFMRKDQVAASPRSARNAGPATTWIEISKEQKEWVILC
ncbi:hypothetical protein LTR05_004077 [Lithohypha guttulata]|uniref:Uncharacterized protein n=1 Tax=Lithohypha guttulata TaxID=1690604 RepID=A0AAN7T2V3_9EURO|nr:hypothetical protein LTR05_004077 [Lithohypha guttulata]